MESQKLSSMYMEKERQTWSHKSCLLCIWRRKDKHEVTKVVFYVYVEGKTNMESQKLSSMYMEKERQTWSHKSCLPFT